MRCSRCKGRTPARTSWIKVLPFLSLSVPPQLTPSLAQIRGATKPAFINLIPRLPLIKTAKGGVANYLLRGGAACLDSRSLSPLRKSGNWSVRAPATPSERGTDRRGRERERGDRPDTFISRPHLTHFHLRRAARAVGPVMPCHSDTSLPLSLPPPFHPSKLANPTLWQHPSSSSIPPSLESLH